MKETTQVHGLKRSRDLAPDRRFWFDQKNKPCTVFEELVLPEAIALPEIKIDKKAADTLKTVPPSPTVQNKTNKKTGVSSDW